MIMNPDSWLMTPDANADAAGCFSSGFFPDKNTMKFRDIRDSHPSDMFLSSETEKTFRVMTSE